MEGGKRKVYPVPPAMTQSSTTTQGAVPLAAQPTVVSSDPTNGTTNVNRGTHITLNVQLVNGAAIDVNTLNLTNVKINRTNDNQFVNANLNTDAGGAVIVIQPTAMLSASTSYTVKVTSGLKDTSGNSFAAFTMSFTTGTEGPIRDPNIVFTKTNQNNSLGFQYTSLAWG